MPVSTHSPRGGRTPSAAMSTLVSIVSTHSPRGGRTGLSPHRSTGGGCFNSLAPRGANLFFAASRSRRKSFNSLAPRGANLDRRSDYRQNFRFNSLAPRGANRRRRTSTSTVRQFQLTRPAGGEPVYLLTAQQAADVSTHSPRGGRTPTHPIKITESNVSTHSPRGGRTSLRRIGSSLHYSFQLTRPAGGEPSRRRITCINSISFNSLAPRGANQRISACVRKCKYVSTHSPRGGRTPLPSTVIGTLLMFQLTRPAGGEPRAYSRAICGNKRFNSLAPRGANPDNSSIPLPEQPVSTHSPRGGRTAV